LFNSGSNAVFAVLAARSLSVSAFGDLALGQLVYFIVIINVVRPVGEALMVAKRSSCDRDVDAEFGTSVLVVFAGSLLLASMFIVIGSAASGSLGAGIWGAIGLALPGLVLQDIVRWACFAQGKFSRALVLDVIWTVAMLCVFIVLRWTDTTASAPFLMIWWGTSGLIVAAALLVASPGLRVVNRIAERSKLLAVASREFVYQAQLSSGLYSAVFIVLGVVGSRAEVASARGATLLFSPLGTIFGGVSISMLSQLTQTDLDASARRSLLRRLTGGALAMVALWTLLVVVLLSLPFNVLGDVQDGVARLVAIVIAMQVVQALLLAPTLSLKASGEMHRMRGIRVLAAVLMVAVGGTGAVLDSAALMLGGLTAAYAVSAVLIWKMAQRRWLSS
jgi:hypothetical protein